ncbi:hypothetical protein HZH66_003447 [Vespula vulgaris]|uniref:Uncharacterized protein n=1 Tax=Vespula vulgaris TaxID=7454 RepID=A0A834KD35_VESVU|nr:hypothetical protein HZH66_003447 [Vespula vulgaris]
MSSDELCKYEYKRSSECLKYEEEPTRKRIIGDDTAAAVAAATSASATGTISLLQRQPAVGTRTVRRDRFSDVLPPLRRFRVARWSQTRSVWVYRRIVKGLVNRILLRTRLLSLWSPGSILRSDRLLRLLLEVPSLLTANENLYNDTIYLIVAGNIE